MPDFWLRITQGSARGADHPVDGALVVGRDPDSDLFLDDDGVSRRHARIADEGDWVQVADLGSSNGTYVNGVRINEPVELQPGDQVQLGSAVLEVLSADAATAVLAAAPVAREGDTDEHPGPLGAATGTAAPRAPADRPPGSKPDPPEGGNLAALAAAFLGPLAIFLLLLSSGAAFFVSLPCAIAAIVLGTTGINKVDRGRTDRHRGLAHLGKVTGIVGTALSTVALIAFFVVAALLDAGEQNLADLIERVGKELGLDLNLPGGSDAGGGRGEITIPDQIRDALPDEIRDRLPGNGN